MSHVVPNLVSENRNRFKALTELKGTSLFPSFLLSSFPPFKASPPSSSHGPQPWVHGPGSSAPHSDHLMLEMNTDGRVLHGCTGNRRSSVNPTKAAAGKAFPLVPRTSPNPYLLLIGWGGKLEKDWGWTRRRQWHPTPVLLPGKSHGRRTW